MHVILHARPAFPASRCPLGQPVPPRRVRCLHRQPERVIMSLGPGCGKDTKQPLLPGAPHSEMMISGPNVVRKCIEGRGGVRGDPSANRKGRQALHLERCVRVSSEGAVVEHRRETLAEYSQVLLSIKCMLDVRRYARCKSTPHANTASRLAPCIYSGYEADAAAKSIA